MAVAASAASGLDYWRQLTGSRIEYMASQDVGTRFLQTFPKPTRNQYNWCARTAVSPAGARAVFESLGKARLYPWISAPSEFAYRIIAGHRDFFYQVTRFTFGTRIEPTRSSATTQWLFLRARSRTIYAIGFRISHVPGHQASWASAAFLPVAPLLASVARTGFHAAALCRSAQYLVVWQRRPYRSSGCASLA